MAEPERAKPAFYAARGGGWRDWWTLLHPPYTAWHLAYVVIGASLVTHINGQRLAATLLAFFLAVGVGAHALDELHGRPLRTTIASPVLLAAAVGGLSAAVLLGIVGVATVGVVLLPFVVLGPFLAAAYNAEWFGGLVHTDAGFAASWGAFPVLVGYAAQAGSISLPAIVAAGGAFALSLGQRALSTPARMLRRRVASVDGSLTMSDGTVRAIDRGTLLSPLESALRSLSWAVVALAVGMALSRVLT
jgi:hypothetical protein